METIERLKSTVQIQKRGCYKTDLTTARIILTGMVFLGFVISGVIEHCLTVALTQNNISAQSVAIQVGNENNGTRYRRYCDPPNMTALAIYYDSSEEIDENDDYDFSQLQEMIFQVTLSSNDEVEAILKRSYLFGTLVSPLPASRLVANIGPKRVFGYALLGAGAATLLAPAAWLSPAHMVIRFSQGLFYGAMLPSAHMLAVNWFPPTLRSSFVSWYSGIYVGYAAAEVLTLPLISAIGHDPLFYIIGLLIILWFVLWSMIVFSTPDKHPRLSEAEKKEIKIKTGDTSLASVLELPWRRMLLSRPVWMSVAATFGIQCAQTTINHGIRLYLRFVYGVTNELHSAIPHFFHWLFALFCGYLVDYIIKIKFVSTTSSRRMFVYVSHFIPAGLIFVVSFVGCDPKAPVALYSLAIILSGAAYAGAYCSSLDITPNFAGTVFGLCCTFGAIGNIFISYLISQVLNGMVLGSWRITFSLTSLILLLTSIFFMLRGSGSVQPWNNPLELKEERALSLKPVANTPRLSLKSKPKFNVEQKILKALYVQEPEKFTRVRAYSTSSPNRNNLMLTKTKFNDKKRASIS